MKAAHLCLLMAVACGRPAQTSVDLTNEGDHWQLAAQGGHAIAHVEMLAVSSPCQLSMLGAAEVVTFVITGPGDAACRLRAELTLDDGEQVSIDTPIASE